MNANELFQALRKAAHEHDANTGEDNADSVDVFRACFELLEKKNLIGELINDLTRRFEGIEEYRGLHEHAFLGLKETVAAGDVYLLGDNGANVFYIPKGWNLMWQDAADHDVPEIRCYAPMGVQPNSEVDIMWVSCKDLDEMRHITKEQAEKIHPRLFEHLATIDKEA